MAEHSHDDPHLRFDLDNDGDWYPAVFNAQTGTLTVRFETNPVAFRCNVVELDTDAGTVAFESSDHCDGLDRYELPARNIVNGPRSSANTYTDGARIYWGAEYLPEAQRLVTQATTVEGEQGR